MRSPRLARPFVAATCLLLGFLQIATAADDAPSAPGQYHKSTFRKRIEIVRKQKNEENVRQLIADVEAAGRVKRDKDYFQAFVELCKELSSSGHINRDRPELARQLAAKELDSPEGMPVSTEIELLLLLQFDPEMGKTETSGEDWRKARVLRVRR